jgi:hypothetical protein
MLCHNRFSKKILAQSLRRRRRGGRLGREQAPYGTGKTVSLQNMVLFCKDFSWVMGSEAGG